MEGIETTEEFEKEFKERIINTAELLKGVHPQHAAEFILETKNILLKSYETTVVEAEHKYKECCEKLEYLTKRLKDE